MRYKVGDEITLKEDVELLAHQTISMLQQIQLLRALGTEAKITKVYTFKRFGEQKVVYNIDKVKGIEFTSSMFKERVEL